jgi:hypothetical protein
MIIGITTIIVDGKIFQWLRAWIRLRSTFWYEFITCYLCLGFWVGGLVHITYNGLTLSCIEYAVIGAIAGFSYNKVIRLLSTAELYLREKVDS